MPIARSSSPPQEENDYLHGRPLPRFVLPEVVGVNLSAEALAQIVQRSVEEMAESLGCERMAVLSYVPRERLLRGVASVGFTESTLRLWQWRLADVPPVERAVRMQQILILPDTVSLPPELEAHITGDRVVVPLFLGERPLAILVGQVRSGVAIRSAAWQTHAEEVAARAALVVELERVAAAYQDEVHLRSSSRELAAAILEGIPLTEIAAILTGAVALRLREERVALFLKDEAGLVTPIHLRNVSPEYGTGAARLASRSVVAARAIATRLPTYARHVQTDTAYPPELRALFQSEGIDAVLIAALHYRERVTGVLVVYPRLEREFTPAELAVFQSFADLATIGVAISQQIEQQRDMAIVEERNRLAREMHDTLAQSLVGLVLQIETSHTLLQQGRHERAAEMLQTAREQAKKALEETRRAVQGLSPRELDGKTPVQALCEEAEQFQHDTGIVTQFLHNGEEQPLSPEQQVTLLRITQEALTNARKHASPLRVRVGLQFGPEEVTLLIEDDGVGFDATEPVVPDSEGGYGLFGMTERVRMVGGELLIDSTQGWGTRVRVRLPYRPSSSLASAPVWIGKRETTAEREAPVLAAVSVVSAAQDRTSAERPAVIRVLVVDDHVVTRQGVRALLEASGDIEVIGEAADGAQAAEQARKLHPDVVLMDLQMPQVGGIEGTRLLHEEMPDLPVVILTTFQTEEAVREVLAAGARGYLLKDADGTDLVTAVRAAYRGEALLAPAITDRLAKLAQSTETGEKLNTRDIELLRLLSQGARNKEIAAKLFVTTGTIEYHLSNLFVKLGVSNRAEAVRVALERGMLSTE